MRRIHIEEKVYYLIILIVFVLLPRISYPQEILTLERAKNIALSKSPIINESQQNLIVWKWRVLEADSRKFPRIDLTETYSRTDNPTLAFSSLLNQERFSQQDFNIERLNDPSAITNYNTRLSLIFPIFNAGTEWIEAQKVRLGMDMQKEGFEWKKQIVLFEVTKAYYEVVYAKARRDVLKKAIDTARKNFLIVEALFQEGMVVKSDYLSSMVNLSSLEQEMIIAENALKNSIYRLNHTMGLPVETVHEFPEGIEEDRFILPELDQLIKDALQRRPDYNQMRITQRLKEKDIMVSSMRFLPSLNIYASYDLNDRDPFGSRGESWLAMAIINMNIFSGFSDYAKMHEERADHERIKYLLQDYESMINLQIREAFLRVNSAKERINVARKAVVQAEEALRIIENRYRAGISGIVELLQAETRLKEHRLSEIKAIFDYNMSIAELKLMAGIMN